MINARIPSGLKKAVDHYCHKNGLKVQALIENLLQEQLEDELDLKTIEERSEESTHSLKDVVANLNDKNPSRS